MYYMYSSNTCKKREKRLRCGLWYRLLFLLIFLPVFRSGFLVDLRLNLGWISCVVLVDLMESICDLSSSRVEKGFDHVGKDGL
jgi:hypothetical protein